MWGMLRRDMSSRARAEKKVGGTRVESEAEETWVEPPAAVAGRRPKAESRTGGAM